MRKLHIISAVEDAERFIWETDCQLYNSRKYNLSEKFRVLVFLPSTKLHIGFSPKWKKLEEKYPETSFFYYPDVNGYVTNLAIEYNYIPIHRLCSLYSHFKAHPELQKSAIFYIDSDVIFTKKPEFEAYINDDIQYLSDTHTYLNAEYIDGKWKDVKPELQQEYKSKNILDSLLKRLNIDNQIVRNNNYNTGGAQYLLKDIPAKFWNDCIDICLLTRVYFQHNNQYYFNGETPLEREDKGVQSWCADMWAIQWNLWKNGYTTSTPKWMDFAWATDEVSKLDRVFMLHNAGVSEDCKIRITEDLSSVKDENGNPIMIETPAFSKEKFKNSTPDIPTLEKIINNETSKKYCTSIYAEELLNSLKNN